MDLEGKILGNRYEIIKRIGSGGMATVYKAKCNLLNRYVAIKVLKEEFTTDEEFIKRFKTEAESAAKLSHPNIVSIYDVGQEGRIHYIVMELIEGKTLKEIIQEGGALSWKWSVNVAAQIASALEVAHKNNIIHRDIKPHNVIMTDDGIAKVTDFGIAKAVSNSTITAFGATIGSVHYFSPEHARGGSTDAKSDIYSLGVVLYELITGRVPFDSDTPVSIALMHIQDSPTPPMQIINSIPKCVNDIILKAMQKDSNLRYESARDMLGDLQVALKKPDLDFVEISASAQVSSSTATVKIPTINKEFLNTVSSSTSSRSSSKGGKREKAKEPSNKNKEHTFKELFKQSRSFRACIIIGIIFVLLIIAGIIFFMLQPKDVEVPELIGKTKEEALTLLQNSKLNMEISEELYSDEFLEGYIISQEPNSPMKVKEGRTIYVKVSKGQEVVITPDVTDKKYTEAINELREASFIVLEEHEYSTKVEKDKVIKQSIEAGLEVSGGSEITIYISDGEEQKFVEMPDLIGMTEDEAKKALSEKNLLVKSPISYVQDDSKENGVVIKQSITKGDTIEEETSVAITVNKLPETVTGTVKVDLNNYKYEEETKYDEEGNPIKQEEKEITVKLTVNGTSVYEKNHKPSEGKISIPVSGTGTINLELYINGASKGTQSMNLDNTRTLNW